MATSVRPRGRGAQTNRRHMRANKKSAGNVGRVRFTRHNRWYMVTTTNNPVITIATSLTPVPSRCVHFQLNRSPPRQLADDE